MSLSIRIIELGGDIRGPWLIDNEHIVEAANMEAEILNRDFPDQNWVVEEFDPDVIEEPLQDEPLLMEDE